MNNRQSNRRDRCRTHSFGMIATLATRHRQPTACPPPTGCLPIGEVERAPRHPPPAITDGGDRAARSAPEPPL